MKYIVLIIMVIISHSNFGQDVPKLINTDSLFNSILQNSKTTFERKSYPKNVIKEFYTLEKDENKLIAFYEYYPNGEVKEKGIFLNGDYFGTWRMYDLEGKVISEIDYQDAKKVIGPQLGYETLFDLYKFKSDSIIRAHFGINNKIKFNASRSYWYSKNDSGSWFEERKEKPSGFLLRYYYYTSELNSFEMMELYFDTQGNFLADASKGLPTRTPYIFNIDYHQALEIAKSKNYELNTVVPIISKRYGFIRLHYNAKEDTYKWVIPIIPKTNQEAIHPNKKDETTVPNEPNSLHIDCNTGVITAVNETITVQTHSRE